MKNKREIKKIDKLKLTSKEYLNIISNLINNAKRRNTPVEIYDTAIFKFDKRVEIIEEK